MLASVVRVGRAAVLGSVRRCGKRRFVATEAAVLPEIYADNAAGVETVLQHVLPSAYVGVDTEFVSFPRYSPKLELLQVSTPTALACVDCSLVPQDVLQSFLRQLGDRECIMHSSSTDLELFESVAGQRPKAVFDTQVASGLVSYGTGGVIGLGQLVQDITEVSLEKTESLSNWAKRPFTKAQIDYALDDVRYLLQLRRELWEKLESLNRTKWFLEEMDTVLKPREVRDPLTLWHSARRILKLKEDPQARATLQQLMIWREEAARKAKLSPVLIMRDDSLIAIATSRPSTTEALLGVQGVKPNTIRFHGRTLLNAIQRGREATECPALPWHLRVPGDIQEASRVLTLGLRAFVQARCLALDIAPALVTSERELQLLALHHLAPELAEQDQPLRVTTGWRNETFGEGLQDFLNGKLGLSWDVAARQLNTTRV
eukprot:m.28898 g.28898  ORF g.28898 m.28898 type:complete len:431 (-) comp8979_c0_seq1:78-1370(-)